ncbi:MAG: hypothetical protein IPL78_29055 [Chloroflexi bacterium]|nr:hypothetical protein [Chloroflexota bacterium]
MILTLKEEHHGFNSDSATLNANFNEGELKTLCLSLNVDYDDLPDSGKANKARELVTYMSRRGQLSELEKAIIKARPHLTDSETPVVVTPPSGAAPRWRLQSDDFERLVNLLSPTRISDQRNKTGLSG